MEKKAGPTFIKRFKALEHIVSLNLVLGRTTEMIRRFEVNFLGELPISF